MRRSLLILSGIILFSCSGAEEETTTEEETGFEPLPYIGFHDVDPETNDSIYHTVPPFFLLAHDSSEFTNERVEGRIHVANFFFTSCPTICPKMINQMSILQEKTADIEEILFLSHTIDPVRDTIPKLQQYIQDRELNTDNWYFLYGDQEYVHDLGQDGYMVNAMEDEAADGGFLHSEHFVLVDREGHIRGLYVGTDPDEVEQLNQDIRYLLDTEYAK